MAEYSISSANLNAIERSLSNINSNIRVLNDGLGVIDNHVDQVNDNVKVVYDEVGALAKEFRDFIQLQVRMHEKSNSQQRLIQIHQELEKRLEIV